MSRMTWLLTAIAATALTVMAASLPPHGFFAGDSGVKLIVARNAANDVGWPIRVALPQVAGQPAPEFLDPFFVSHTDHAHGLTSSLLPLLSAPLARAFGLRGVYVIPLLAFVAMVPLLVVAQRRMRLPGMPAMTAAIALLANPLLFYALEFWEHAPAVAALTGATALALGTRRTDHVLAGACVAVAVLLRPEAVWYAVALVAAAAWLKRRVASVALVAAGASAVLVLPLALNYLHGGSLLEPHVSANAGALGDAWLSGRLEIAASWLSVAPPGRQSLWQWLPLLILAVIPAIRSRETAALTAMAVICVLGVWLTVPNDGGAQWGPRYLLVATPPLLLLAAASASALWHRPHRVLAAAVVVVLAAGLMQARAAYRELRGSKQVYAALADGIEAGRGPARIVITDLWWLDQLAAALYPGVTFLYVSSPAAAAAAAARLTAAGEPFVLASSAAESPVFSRNLALGTGCAPERIVSLSVRDVALYSPGCRE